MKVTREINPKKKVELARLLDLFERHSTILIASISDLPSAQLQQIRKSLKKIFTAEV